MAGVPLSPWTSLSQAKAANPQLCPGSPFECLRAWLSPWTPYYLFFSPATGVQFPEAQWGPLTPQNPHPHLTCHIIPVFRSARPPPKLQRLNPSSAEACALGPVLR